jgi:UDP-3-O-[3-hydroxymyristoyl] glucosamine N-acyltransferase
MRLVASGKIVHPTAVVDGQLGEEVSVGPFAFVSEGASIGDRTMIGAHVTIASNVSIGADCIIQPGVRIGEEGFGYRKEGAHWIHRPHSGGVVIGNDVHIGANTVVDQGTVEPTRIGRGARIGTLCWVAHNVQIGSDAMIVGLIMLSGSVRIGDRAYLAPAAAVREHQEIAEDAFVGLGAVVVKDVPPGETVAGVPARPIDRA